MNIVTKQEYLKNTQRVLFQLLHSLMRKQLLKQNAVAFWEQLRFYLFRYPVNCYKLSVGLRAFC